MAKDIISTVIRRRDSISTCDFCAVDQKRESSAKDVMGDKSAQDAEIS